MNILQPIIDGLDGVNTIISNGSPENPKNFPHKEVIAYLSYFESFNIKLSELLPIKESEMYLKLMSALQIIAPGLTKDQGKASFAAIIKVIGFFIVSMDNLILITLNKAWENEVAKLKEEILRLSMKLKFYNVDNDSKLKSFNVVNDLNLEFDNLNIKQYGKLNNFITSFKKMKI
jgi:hypothetical protein